MTRLGPLFGSVVGVLLLVVPAGADSITMEGGLKYDQNVRILNIREGQITFTVQGRETSKPTAGILTLNATGEPALNAAEQAYVVKKWDEAATNYQKAMQATAQDWVRRWSRTRLSDAAGRSGRFDLVIAAYVPVLLEDPNTAKSMQLTWPAADSPQLAAAAVQIRAAINDRLTVPQKVSLYELLLEALHRRNDAKAVEETITQLAGIDPQHRLVKEQQVRRLLSSLQQGLAAKEYDNVIQSIMRDTSRFNTPDLQAEAMYCLAEAKAGKLGAAAKEDDWKDVALDYMRLAAMFPADAPRVADALLRTAEILETRLKDARGALGLYEKIAADYRNQAAGRAADEHLRRLKPQ